MDLKQTLSDLRHFVFEEQKANNKRMLDIWLQPVADKIKKGQTQIIESLSVSNNNYLTLSLGKNESRFRVGDYICLHSGDPTSESTIRQGNIEAENDGEWLVFVKSLNQEEIGIFKAGCYADPDSIDLTHYFEQSLNDVASSKLGQEVILPILSGQIDIGDIYEDNYDEAADFAEDQGLNDKQAEAVGLGVAARYVACIQGPPGTGKTKVISLIAKLLAKEGQSVFLTSHNHMAINNALNKIANEGVPTAKIGSKNTVKGLNENVPQFPKGSSWKERPDKGYVIGATPFATCSYRLDDFHFDTVIFDEASQITVPLAVMAMRKSRRFIFVGDHKQLPPVVLSKSILNKTSTSIFSNLIQRNTKTSVLLSETYRMSRFLSQWPSETYYNCDLVSEGDNRNKTLHLPVQGKYSDVFSKNSPFVYIESPGINQRTSNPAEASLVSDLILEAHKAGLPLSDIGVVTPFRNHSKLIKRSMERHFSMRECRDFIADTVERMQGQERELIIVSLCSTDPQFISSIEEFLFQDERINVAITRPIAKLILIGPKISPSILTTLNSKESKDRLSNYRSLIKSAQVVTI